jgi:hypothetical protein
MALFGRLNENNIVVDVIVVGDDDINNAQGLENEQMGIEFCQSLCGQDTNWVQGSKDGSFRFNPIGIGTIYDQNFASWNLNEETCQWEPPIPYPQDGNYYRWDEQKVEWEKIPHASEL